MGNLLGISLGSFEQSVQTADFVRGSGRAHRLEDQDHRAGDQGRGLMVKF